jgi:hypothetical protein
VLAVDKKVLFGGNVELSKYSVYSPACDTPDMLHAEHRVQMMANIDCLMPISTRLFFD